MPAWLATSSARPCAGHVAHAGRLRPATSGRTGSSKSGKDRLGELLVEAPLVLAVVAGEPAHGGVEPRRARRAAAPAAAARERLGQLAGRRRAPRAGSRRNAPAASGRRARAARLAPGGRRRPGPVTAAPPGSRRHQAAALPARRRSPRRPRVSSSAGLKPTSSTQPVGVDGAAVAQQPPEVRARASNSAEPARRVGVGAEQRRRRPAAAACPPAGSSGSGRSCPGAATFTAPRTGLR